jgi:hypothetical protein
MRAALQRTLNSSSAISHRKRIMLMTGCGDSCPC